jgi:hypothetical protein
VKLRGFVSRLRRRTASSLPARPPMPSPKEAGALHVVVHHIASAVHLMTPLDCDFALVITCGPAVVAYGSTRDKDHGAALQVTLARGIQAIDRGRHSVIQDN